MNTPSDELFLLIKSLNSQEKVQFKMYASRRKENSNYILLFDAIDKQKTYNEKELKKFFKKKPFIKYLYRIKPYIQESILKCLQEYYQSDSVDAVLCNRIQQIEILMNKRLFGSAKKLINKAEKFALENHQYLYLLNIRGWKRKIMGLEQNVEAMRKCYKEWHLNELYYVELYKNVLEYKKLDIPSIICGITRQGDQNEVAIAELRTILNDPLLKNEAAALSYPAKFLHHRILGELYILLKNHPKSYSHFKKAIQYFESARIPPNERLSIYINLMLPLRALKKNDEWLVLKKEAAEFIQSIPQKAQTNTLHSRYLSLMNNYIAYHASVFNFKEALIAGDEILPLIEKHASVQTSIVYYCNRSILHFIMTEYHQALHCANKILATEKTGIRQEVTYLVKILSLLIHYELGNENMLPNLYRSYSRYFKIRKRNNKAEHVLLNFFGKTIHATSAKQRKDSGRQERITLFIALKKELELCKTEPILNEFDFISWAESKIENRPMIDILKEKVKRV